MYRAFAIAAVFLLGLATGTRADIDLEKLDPEFRAHQACIYRGLDVVRREPTLRHADRMKTSIFNQALVQDTKLIAKGGAVRSDGHWFALSFSCDLTKDWMKATSFSFTLGTEIPEREWNDLGLWR